MSGGRPLSGGSRSGSRGDVNLSTSPNPSQFQPYPQVRDEHSAVNEGVYVRCIDFCSFKTRPVKRLDRTITAFNMNCLIEVTSCFLTHLCSFDNLGCI